MGDKADVEIAAALRRQADSEARQAEQAEAPAKWRWSRSGWGGWAQSPSIPADPPGESDEETR